MLRGKAARPQGQSIMGGVILEGAVRGGLSKEVTFVDTAMMGGRGPRSSLGWEVSGSCLVLIGFVLVGESEATSGPPGKCDKSCHW